MISESLIGKGFNSNVYAWGHGQVLKLFHNWVTPAKIEREFISTRAIHATGLPVPAVYELVELEGKRGIIFERLDGISVMQYVQSKPWEMFRLTRHLAELHAQIHRCACPSELPSQRDWIAERLEAVDLPEEEKEAVRRRLAELPDGNAICHGDFHPENVLLTQRGLVVIDWDTATRGHPLGDVACTSRLIQTAQLPSWAPRFMHLLVKCSRVLLHRTYLKRYLQVNSGTREQVETWQKTISKAFGAWRVPGQVVNGASREGTTLSNNCEVSS
jgi:uncharacterized protein (TIGR02172 family)